MDGVMRWFGEKSQSRTKMPFPKPAVSVHVVWPG